MARSRPVVRFAPARPTRLGCAAMLGSNALPIVGRRVLITGAARGIGAALAQRLHERGAHVALAGIEPELLAATAASCGDAAWSRCDVSDRDEVEAAVAAA